MPITSCTVSPEFIAKCISPIQIFLGAPAPRAPAKTRRPTPALRATAQGMPEAQAGDGTDRPWYLHVTQAMGNWRRGTGRQLADWAACNATKQQPLGGAGPAPGSARAREGKLMRNGQVLFFFFLRTGQGMPLWWQVYADPEHQRLDRRCFGWLLARGAAL